MNKPSIALRLTAVLALGTTMVQGQTPSPQPAGESRAAVEAQTPVIRSQVNVVLVPALVMNKSGEVIHGLTAKDFVVEEAGVERNIKLDDFPEEYPMSVVVVVQTGRSACLQFEPPADKPQDDFPPVGTVNRKLESRRLGKAPLSGLAEMVEGFVGESAAELALLSFDSRVRLEQDFTSNIPDASSRLAAVQPTGDEGAAILDAVAHGLDMLAQRPGRRHVLLLISEQRDHGSRRATLEQVVQRIAASNTLLYSVAFSPLGAEFKRDLKGQQSAPGAPRVQDVLVDPHTAVATGSGGVNLLTPLLNLVIQGMQKNVGREMARMTGGEYHVFAGKRGFDDTLSDLSNHVRNRYLLSFQTRDVRPGAHLLTVRLRQPKPGITVLARNSYWVTGNQSAAAEH